MSEYTDAFEEFWKVYPKKQAKPAAFKSWTMQGCEDKAKLITAHVAKRARQDVQWLGSRRMIPNCTTFLNQLRWEDEYETVEDARNAEDKRDARRHSQSALDFEEVRRAVKYSVLRNYTDEQILNTFAITPRELATYRTRLKDEPSILLNDLDRQFFSERPETELVEVVF